ncbi:MAG: hypothetical protein ACI4FN_08220 [Acutalibacteraceae bacterium]
MFKKLTALFTALLITLLFTFSAFAHDVPEEGKKGSVSVTMRFGDTVVAGGTLTLYRVGEVKEDDGNYSFVPTGDFAGFEGDFAEPSSDQLAKNLANFAKNSGIEPLMIQEVNSEGKALFNDLEQGLYLLVQTEAAVDWQRTKPFLAGIPYFENGEYRYDADASPKVGLDTTDTLGSNNSINKPGLPQTGQLNWPIPVLAVCGLTLIALGVFLRLDPTNKKAQEL